MISSGQFARMGEAFLTEAVRGVLLDAKKKGEQLSPSEIAKRSGVSCNSLYDYDEADKGKADSGKYALIWGVLGSLRVQRKIQVCNAEDTDQKKRRWELTEDTYKEWRDGQ